MDAFDDFIWAELEAIPPFDYWDAQRAELFSCMGESGYVFPESASDSSHLQQMPCTLRRQRRCAVSSAPSGLSFPTIRTSECFHKTGRWNDEVLQAIKATEGKHWPVGTSLKYIKHCLQEISHTLRNLNQELTVLPEKSSWLTEKPGTSILAKRRASREMDGLVSLLASALEVIPVLAWLAGRDATKISEMATEFGDLAYDVRALIVLRAIGVDFSEKAGVGCAALFLQCVLPMVPTRSDWGPDIRVIIDQPIQILPGDVGWLDRAARYMASRPSNKKAWFRLDNRIRFLVHFSHSKSAEHEDSELESISSILNRWLREDWVAAGVPSAGPVRYKSTGEFHQALVSMCTRLSAHAKVTKLRPEQLVQIYEEHGLCQLLIALRIFGTKEFPIESFLCEEFPMVAVKSRNSPAPKKAGVIAGLNFLSSRACVSSYMKGYCSCQENGSYSRSFMPVEKLELFSNTKKRSRTAVNHIVKWKRLEREATVGYKGVYYVGKHIYQVHASVSESRERTLQVALMEYVSAGGTRSVSESIDLGAVKVTSTNQILDDMQGQPVYYGDSWKTCVESGNEIVWRLISRIAGGYTAVKRDWSSCWATALEEEGVVVDFVPTLFLLMSAAKVETVKGKLVYPNGALATVARVDEFAHIKFPGMEAKLGGKKEKFTGKEEIVTGTDGTVWALWDLPVGGTGVPMDSCKT